MNDAKGNRVDVLKTMGAVATALEVDGYLTTASNFAEARAAVAELIEADIAFNEAFHAWLADKNNPKVVDVFCAAADVREAALNRVGGAT